MKLLIVSDIHANLEALQTVLAESHDELWVLGDLVNYGPNPRSPEPLLKQKRRFRNEHWCNDGSGHRSLAATLCQNRRWLVFDRHRRGHIRRDLRSRSARHPRERSGYGAQHSSARTALSVGLCGGSLLLRVQYTLDAHPLQLVQGDQQERRTDDGFFRPRRERY